MSYSMVYSKEELKKLSELEQNILTDLCDARIRAEKGITTFGLFLKFVRKEICRNNISPEFYNYVISEIPKIEQTGYKNAIPVELSELREMVGRGDNRCSVKLRDIETYARIVKQDVSQEISEAEKIYKEKKSKKEKNEKLLLFT